MQEAEQEPALEADLSRPLGEIPWNRDGCDPSASTAAAQRSWPGSCFISPRNAFCITLYNEGCESLRTTLESLLKAIRCYHRNAQDDTQFSMICIVADGIERFDPNVAILLIHLGVIRAGPWQFRGGVDLHYSMHDSGELLQKLGEPLEHLNIAPVRFVVCVKERNSGKLRSHVLFFGELCPRLRPAFCYQVDTGTAIEETSVVRIARRMKQMPEVAAVAPCVLPCVPGADSDLLQLWQYFDFAYRKGVSWPFEVAAGFLSVVPGQVSAFRWAALHDPEVASEHVAATEPLNAYLQGASATSSLHRLMYLAEDRVIGAQLVLARGRRWKLDYLPGAEAITDACDTFRELLRQRRRWNNSAIACRVWLASLMPDFFLRADRSAAKKMSFFTAVVAQSVLALREILAPALLAALLMVLWPATVNPSSPMQGWIAKLFWSVTAGDLLLGLIRFHDGSRARLVGRLHLVLGVLSALLYPCLLVTLPLATGLVLLAPAIALVPMLLVLRRKAALTLVRMQLSPLPGFLMFSLILTYSLFNLHDVSWGTKGLKGNSGGSRGAGALKNLRNAAFPTWLLVNFGLAFAAFTSTSAGNGSLNLVIAISCLTDAALATVATGHLLAHRLCWRTSEATPRPRTRWM